MKKFIKIFTINIVFILTILLLAEIFCICLLYKVDSKKYCNFKEHLAYIFKSYKEKDYFYNIKFRKAEYASEKNNKKKILILGCSYAYGLHLTPNEFFSSKISKLSNRTVYNLSLIGGSARDALYILRDKEFLSKKIENNNNFEYIIYVYISHHNDRLYTDIKAYNSTPYFKEKNGELEYYAKNKLLANSYLYKKFLELKYSKLDKEKSCKLQNIYFKEINREIKSQFPNAKFVILVYDDSYNQDWKSLEEEDIKIIKIFELENFDPMNQMFRLSENDFHPSAKVWEVVTPQLVEKLNL